MSATPQAPGIPPGTSPEPRARPRRLAFVIEALTVGGAERLLVAMANGFAARGDEVHVICLAFPGELADELDARVGRHHLDKRRGIDPRLPWRLRALIRRLRPDAINSHLWVANFWTRLALVGTGARVLITEHSRDTWKPALHRALDRALVPFTDTLVAVSADTADFYRREIGVPDSLVRVVNNGIDTARYAGGDGRALRTAWLTDPEAILVGSVGRLVTAKNHPRLIEACALARARGHPLALVIVGDGPERARIVAEIERHGLGDAVTLAGPRADVPDVLAALDLFALSSDREGHPLAVLEAQAAGVPVVATRAGGTAEALAREGDTVGGVLVDADARALADAIGALEADRPALARMAAFSRAHAAAHFDTGHMLDAYARLFDRARERRGSVRRSSGGTRTDDP